MAFWRETRVLIRILEVTSFYQALESERPALVGSLVHFLVLF